MLMRVIGNPNRCLNNNIKVGMKMKTILVLCVLILIALAGYVGFTGGFTIPLVLEMMDKELDPSGIHLIVLVFTGILALIGLMILLMVYCEKLKKALTRTTVEKLEDTWSSIRRLS